MEASCGCEQPDLLERLSQISNIAFASASLVLAYYVFVYQRNKDRHTNKLEWFKDLIIEPHKTLIYDFFRGVLTTSRGLKSYQLTDIVKSQIVDDLKASSATFRRDFIVLLGSVDLTLEKDVLHKVDQMIDEITRVSFDANYNLSNDAEFDANVEILISDTRVYVLSRIFKYEG